MGRHVDSRSIGGNWKIAFVAVTSKRRWSSGRIHTGRATKCFVITRRPERFGRMDRGTKEKIDLRQFIIPLFRSLNEAAIDPFSPFFFSIGTMNGRLISHDGDVLSISR